MRVERRDIEIFLTLADELNFTRTAERLHVTTARVSQTIKQLERRFGTPLFDRTSRRVTLTPVGRRLRDDLAPAFQQIEEAVARAVAAGRGIDGVLRVGFVGAAAGSFVLKVNAKFAVLHPSCEIRIRENQFGDALELLRADEIDLLLAALPCDEPDLSASGVLVRERTLLAVSARHPFAKRESVRLADLARVTVLSSPPQIPDYWDDHLAPSPGRRGPAFSTIQEMLTLVGADQGVYPVAEQVNRYYLRPDVVYLPISDAPPIEWGLVWRTTGDTTRLRAYRETARDLAAAGQGMD